MTRMKGRKHFIVLLALTAASLLMILLPACTLQANESPQLDRSANFTQAAMTLDAQLTLAAEGAFPTITPLSTQAGTTIPVITPTLPGAPTQGATEGSGTGSACDRGTFVADVTIPDGTVFAPGDGFVKTWRIKNEGTCTWTPEYVVVFDSGDAMDGPASFSFTQTNIPPGQEVEISVNLTAPDQQGEYRGDWLLRNPAGQTFGLGSQGTASFWVVINVEDTPDVSISFDNVHACGGAPTAIFKLQNRGDLSLESVEIEFINQTTGQTIFGPFASNAPFMGGTSECPPGGDAVPPDAVRYIGGELGSSPASGDTIEARFTICNQEDLSGGCVDKTVTFNAP